MKESDRDLDWGGGRWKDFVHQTLDFFSRIFWSGDARSEREAIERREAKERKAADHNRLGGSAAG